MSNPKKGTREKRNVDFDDLCSGKVEKGYSFNLTSLNGVTTTDEAVKNVDKQITDTLAALQKVKTIDSETVYIGKTSTKKMQRCDALDPMDENTMEKSVIGIRYQAHMRDGRDVMILVTVVTQTVAEALKFTDDPAGTDPDKFKSAALKCALEIEDKIQRKRELRDPDAPYHEGSKAKEAEAYPLYVAFKYQTSRRSTESPEEKNPKAYYSFNLADLLTVDTVQKAIDTIGRRIESICEDLHISTRKNTKMTLGHAYVEKRADCSTFSHTDPSTFDKKDIQDKFHIHKTEGSDGMFVVAVVTTEKATELQKEDALTCVKEIEAKLSQNQGWDTVKPNGNDKKGKNNICLYFTFSLQVE